MAKYEVTVRFRDRHTGEIHKKGDVIDITKKRAEEILQKGELIKPKESGK
jgi:hypothetical protein